jgi:hypothetical protein
MAVVQNLYTGDGVTVLYSLSFSYLDQTNVKVSVNGSVVTNYIFATASSIQFTAAPANGAAIRIYRETDIDEAAATIFPGSSIKAKDLNDNFTQTLYAVQESNSEADSATATANQALTNSNTAISTANAAVVTANTAESNSLAAISTANTAETNSLAAVSTANTASSNASAAVSTANAASVTAASAVSTANSAVSTANAATATANQAASDAASAISTANTASSNASAAVSTANTAASNASTAVSTANSAVSTANSAVSTANSAVSTANTALSNSTTAISTANAAAAAVASAVLYAPVADLTALALLTPADGDYFELQDSTGAESDPSITGVPSGLAGDTGLSFRLRYDDPPGEYVFLEYFATDSETRYAVKATEADASQALSDAAAAQADATQALSDAAAAQADATQALSDAAAAQGDATQALSDAAAAQGDATQALSDAAAAQSTANAALPTAGGTLTGDVTLANQTDLRFGEATANGTNYVGFQAPASITADVLWTLPATDATVAGHALKSDASGTLSWGTAGGATGGGTDDVFYENSQTVTTNYTLTTNKNAMSAGPITIDSGVTVTVPAGQAWSIV